jgi:ubiquinone/menaquinone biosynthesis C-methylase UbiE
MKSLLHKFVAIPAIYDFCQRLAGASVNRRIFREEFTKLPPQGRILDVGGGTGLMRPLLPAAWSYCCLDPDPQKLEGFRAKFPYDESLQCSACEMLVPDESFDLCIMCAVSHHLTDEDLRRALAEIKRVLRPGGYFMLMDAVWNPANVRGRFLWSVDRGSFPKTESALEAHVQDHLRIDRRRSWRVHHEYALYWGRKD